MTDLTKALDVIQKTIETIFMIANFWLPGCVFLLTFQRMIGVKTESNLHTHVFSVLISILLRFCAEIIPVLRGRAELAQPYSICFLYSLFGFLLALLLAKLYRSKKLSDGFASIFVKSLHDDIWSDVIDFQNGTILYLTLKNGNRVTGGFHSVEEKGNDSWLSLDNYILEDRDGTPLTDSFSRMEHPESNTEPEPLLLLRVSEIERFEVKYLETSKPARGRVRPRDQQEL